MSRVVLLALALAISGCATGPSVTVGSLVITPDAGGFTIAWQLSAPGFARLDHWESAHPETRKIGAVRPLPGVDYRVTLTNLTPDTEYAYQVLAGPDAAFGDAAFRTPPATLRTPPAIKISDISIDAESQTATVSWRTSRPTDTTVAYGRTEELEARKTNATQAGASKHSLALSGLEPGLAYQLKVVATDAAGAAPVTFSPVMPFTTKPAASTMAARIMPRQGPHTNTLVDLSRDYLKRLKNLSAAEKADLEKQIQSQSPEERIALSPQERAELTATPTDPADRAQFDRRIDLLQRWIIHLGQRGKDIEPLTRTAVTLSNRYFVAPPQAAQELDRTVKSLSELDAP